MNMKTIYNKETGRFTFENVTVAEAELIQNGLIVTRSGKHIPAEFKEDKKLVAEMILGIDNALIRSR